MTIVAHKLIRILGTFDRQIFLLPRVLLGMIILENVKNMFLAHKLTFLGILLIRNFDSHVWFNDIFFENVN